MPKPKKPTTQIRGTFRPSTVNEEERTVELTWTTGADALRWDPYDGVRYYERLRVDDQAIDMTRLQSGAPLLDNHDRYSGMRAQIGVVERAWIEDGEGRAVVRFSKRAEVEPVFRDVADGIIRNVSVGYAARAMQKVGERDGIAVREVTQWEPHEVSLVTVNADARAQVRGASEIEEEEPMVVPNNHSSTEARAASPVGPAPAPDSVGVDEARRAGAEQERARIQTITELATRAKVPELARSLIEEGRSVEQARAAILDALVERDASEVNHQHVEVVDPSARAASFRLAMVDGILARALQTTPSEAGRDYAGMSLLRAAEEVLRQRGERVSFARPSEIAQRAMATADFTAIMADVAGRSLRQGYEGAPQTFRPLFRQSSAANFKNVERVALSDAPNLEPVAEGADYTEGTLSDAKETYRVTKFGRIVAVTWEAIINDDLDAISRFPQRLGAAASFRESDTVWGLLNANGVMADGQPIFSAAHSNTAGGVFGLATVKAARTAMRKQSTPQGRAMNLFPTYLVVGPDLENEAELMLQENALVVRGEILPQRLRGLNLVVEPRITGTRWFMTTDTNQVDTLEYAYLSGEEGVRLTSSEEPFTRDGVSWKARLVFGAGVIDFRGLYMGTGVAP
jgi:hypothetical protein